MKKLLFKLLFIITLCLSIINLNSYKAYAASAVPETVIAYLKKMQSAKGKFTQIGPDGVISQGDFGLRKPGKMYFNYNDPTPLKVISDGFWVAVEDKKLKTSDRYPLSETPLSVLLSDNPDFSNTDYKIAVTSDTENHYISASDPKHPERGSITIAFTKQNTQLTHWVVTDAQGLKTIVNLQDVALNVPTQNKLFFIDTSTGQSRQ